jgi:tripartite-type tricarboxylate transporter receptor subunit TctC
MKETRMHTLQRRRALQHGLGLAACLAVPWGRGARAQVLPDTARVIVGFPPGGAPDIVARRLADGLQGTLAKAVIVDNRPGAAGRIAVDVARAAPSDGTTLLLNPAGVLTINPHTYRKLSYDPFKDLAPLSLAAQIDFGFAVGSAVPREVTNLADFARWAHTHANKVAYGSPAAGSPPHFVGDALARALSIPMIHVPYRGGAAALNELMGGQIAAAVLTLGDLVAHAKAGRLRLLAATGTTRSRHVPDVPTFSEQKVPGLEARDWFGIYIAGSPAREVIARVAPLVRTAISARAYVDALATASLDAASSSPEELDRLARVDHARWAPIIKASGFVADV